RCRKPEKRWLSNHFSLHLPTSRPPRFPSPFSFSNLLHLSSSPQLFRSSSAFSFHFRTRQVEGKEEAKQRSRKTRPLSPALAATMEAKFCPRSREKGGKPPATLLLTDD
ncbi:unnamed protein product, partial [Linum tenue]